MQSTLAQTVVDSKPVVITGTPYAWGLEDGATGKGEFVGYEYFNGAKYGEWRKGWQAGRTLRNRRQVNH